MKATILSLSPFFNRAEMQNTRLNNITSDAQFMTERVAVVIGGGGLAGAQCVRDLTGCVGAVLIETRDNTVSYH